MTGETATAKYAYNLLQYQSTQSNKFTFVFEGEDTAVGLISFHLTATKNN